MEQKQTEQTTKLVRVPAWIYVVVDVLTAGILVLAGYSWKEDSYAGVIFLVLYAMCKKFTERTEPIKQTTTHVESGP